MPFKQKATNVTRVAHRIEQAERERRNGHSGGVLWFTGLSGAGKSTLAVQTEDRLFREGYQVYVLDGDNLRHGLNSDLGFSPEDRTENIRRVGEVAALLARAGFITISAFISPYIEDRQRARQSAEREGQSRFHEVYVKADLAICESRDPKGLYHRARLGEIPDFTGISAPYEAPEAPELIVDSGHDDVDTCVNTLVDYVKSHFRLP